jgi:hypothetical protein
MARVVLEQVCIASIYPGKTDVIRLPHGPGLSPRNGRLTAYSLEPVPRDKTPGIKWHSRNPFVLTVDDAYESVPAPWKSKGPVMAIDTMPVDVNQIADYLVNQWAGNLMGMPAGVTPGIMRIRGTVPHNDEIQELIQKQTAYAEHMLGVGDMLFQEPRERKWITTPMRESAIWLGRSRNWINAKVDPSAEKIPCRFCKAPVDQDAYVCQTCSRVLRAIPAELDLEQPKMPPAPATEKPQPTAG